MKAYFKPTAFACAALAFALLASSPATAKQSHSDIVQISQMRLADLGYKVGREDGILGHMTKEALATFQRDNGLEITGMLTPETYSCLTHDRRFRGAAYYPAYGDTYHSSSFDHIISRARSVAYDHDAMSAEIISQNTTNTLLR